MDSKNIMQQGEEAKYQITITRQNFIMANDNFQVKLSWGMMGKTKTILKSDMLSNDDGNWFFTFDTSDMLGRVTAECSFDIPDEDYSDGYRTEINRQFLCFIVGHPLPARICIPGAPSTQTVIYERTEVSDVEEMYDYLTDSRGRIFKTADNELICVLKDY